MRIGWKSFLDVWTDSVRFVAPATGAVVGLVTLAVGGLSLWTAGTACALVASLVLTTAVTYFRYQSGARGFPRRLPLRTGDQIGVWRIVDHVKSAMRPDGTFTVRHGDDFGVLKVDQHHSSHGGVSHRRAEREADYLKRVRSSHVVGHLDSASTAAYSYLITEYLGDQTLWDRRQRGPVDDAEMYSVAVGSLKGLADLHAVDITHRDLTPRNIVVDPNGAATLIDLGIAIRDATTRLTKTNAQIFTTGYRSPEQFIGEVSAKSDVFVWAATMYFLATGEQAFPGDDAEVYGRVTQQTPNVGSCPTWIQPVLLRCFERDPQTRPTATEALGLLAAVKQPGWSVKVHGHPTPPRTNRAASWLPSAAVTSVLVFALTSVVLQAVETHRIRTANATTTPVTTVVAPVPSTVVGSPVPTGASTTTPSAPLATVGSAPSSSTSTSTTKTTTALSPVSDFVGVWYGASVGGANEIPVVFSISEASANQPGAPLGSWSYLSCTGTLRLVSATSTELVATPVEVDATECGFGGEATLVRADNTASYEWKSATGTDKRSGTFKRRTKIALRNPGWPTDSNEASSAFQVNLGVCATGASGCSRSGQFPRWTACTTNNLCIAGGDSSVVDVWRNLTWVLEIPDAAPNTAVALLAVGFSDEQVIDLLDL
jgi:serine/threonine protein kinase